MKTQLLALLLAATTGLAVLPANAATLHVEASDEVALIVDDTVTNERLFAGYLDNGETREWTVENPLDVQFSAGAALQFSLDGKTFEPAATNVGRVRVDVPANSFLEVAYPPGEDLFEIRDETGNALEATFEQLEAAGGVERLARLTRAYYEALQEAGFSSAQALEIVCAQDFLGLRPDR